MPSLRKRKKSFHEQDEFGRILTETDDFFVQEAYKTLRTNVTFSVADEDRCQVILVTSAVEDEGKSITGVNLAISYAQAGKKVLLLDCNLRRPAVYRFLNIDGTVGLSNLLIDPSLFNEAVLSHHIPGLSVILSGDIPPNPSELLGSPAMEKLMQRLREDFDYIIMDTPPVTGVTDPTVLAPLADGVLMVVRANYTNRTTLGRALEQLEYTKTKILGFVLNGVRNENKDKYH